MEEVERCMLARQSVPPPQPLLATLRRGCKLIAPCCDTAFWCRFCHDVAKEHPLTGDTPHKLDRHAVRELERGASASARTPGGMCA